MLNASILSIERARSRQLLCQGALLGAGVPAGLITLSLGEDQNDYPDAHAVCEAGAARHPHFRYIIEAGTDLRSRGYMAQMWGYLDAVESIAAGDDLVLLIQDDYCMHAPIFYDLLNSFSVWLHEQNELLVLLGGYSAVLLHYPCRELVYVDGSTELLHGINGQHDTAIVFSPAGAAWFYEATQRFPQEANMQCIISAMSYIHTDLVHPPGTYTWTKLAFRPIVGDSHSGELLPSLIHTDNVNMLTPEVEARRRNENIGS